LYGFAAAYEGLNAFWAKYLFFDATFTHQVFTHFPQASYEMPLAGSGNQFWSISVEEQFYLIAPMIMLLPFGRKLMVWAAVAIVLLMAGVAGAPIALGVLAAALRHNLGDWHLTPLARPLLLIGTAAVLTSLFFADLAPLRAMFAVGVVLNLAVPGKRQALPIFLGGISYPVYLNHWIGAFVAHGITRHLLHLSEGSTATAALVVAFAYPTSLMIGAVAYWFIDRRVLARRDMLFTWSRGLACGATAYALVIIGLAGGTLMG
jgi:peptidoglycan/LPS O-acetylase OafA/YrhL